MRFKASNMAPLLLAVALLTAPGAHAEGVAADSQVVSATYYAKHYAGRRTASGERYNPKDFTAAHPTLPLGTVVLVTRPANGRQVIVRINDRNGGQPGIDLSEAAARALNLIVAGRDRVIVAPLEQVAERP